VCKGESQVHGIAVERTLDGGEMTWNRCGLAAGMRLHHSAISAIVRHAFAAVALGFAHSSGGHKTCHNRRLQQKERQERNSDSANPLHSLSKSIGSTTIGRNTALKVRSRWPSINSSSYLITYRSVKRLERKRWKAALCDNSVSGDFTH
jgi:hypothetical protein